MNDSNPHTNQALADGYSPAESSAQVVPELNHANPPAFNAWKEWDAFLEGRPDTGFMQSSWWIDFRSPYGFEHFGATLRDENGLAGGAVILRFQYSEESCFYYIQDGPVLPHDE